MKKIQIIILSLLCSFSALSQIKIKTEQVELTLSKGTQRVNKPQSITNNDGTITSVIGGEYEFEGQFISFNYGKINKNSNFLTEIKAGVQNRRKRLDLKDKYYQNTTTQVNGNSILIIRNQGDGYNYLLFYVINKTVTYHVRGTLQFIPCNELKAKEYLNEIIKTIVFKN